MSFFTQTRAKGPGRFLEWKVRLFAVAAVMLLIGMAREIDALVIAAVALLAVAFALRFFERDEEETVDVDDEEFDADDDYAGGDEPRMNDDAGPDGPTPDDFGGEPRRAVD